MNRIAGASVSVKVTGAKRTRARMSDFSKRVQEAIFVRAVQPSLTIVSEAAKRNAAAVQSASGGATETRKAIASRIGIRMKRSHGSRYYSKGSVAVFYGKPRGTRPKQRPGDALPLWVRASLAHLIEFGYNLTHYFGRRVKSRHISARPFMRPAFEANKAKAEDRFRSVLKSEIDKADNGS